MFRMCGNRVKILRYQIEYVENEEQRIEYAVTEEEANEITQRYNGVKSMLPPSDDEWMDGLEVEDVPDTYAEAMKICALGEEAYKQQVEDTKKQRIAQLRADIDFLSAMTGVIL